MARRMRGRSGARRQHRADAAPQTPARRGRRKAPERRRRYERTIRATATITRESAADFRKQGRGRSENAWTAKRQGVKAIWRLPNPRDARRNMRLSPEPRPPEIGRASTSHGVKVRRLEGCRPSVCRPSWGACRLSGNLAATVRSALRRPAAASPHRSAIARLRSGAVPSPQDASLCGTFRSGGDISRSCAGARRRDDSARARYRADPVRKTSPGLACARHSACSEYLTSRPAARLRPMRRPVRMPALRLPLASPPRLCAIGPCEPRLYDASARRLHLPLRPIVR